MMKKAQLKQLIQRLHQGEPQAQVQADFKRDFGHISSQEISQIEQELIAEGVSVSEIQKLCNVHAAIFSGRVSDLHRLDEIDQQPGHPLMVFRKENQGLVQFIQTEVEPLLQHYIDEPSAIQREDLLAAIKQLSKLERHYARKENLLFPYLEKRGISGPTQVMWGKDDEIREQWKTILNTELESDALVQAIQELLAEIDSMIIKENDILSPLLLEHILPQEWQLIAEASPEIGYAFNGGIEGASPSDANFWLMQQLKTAPPAPELAQTPNYSDEIVMPSGRIALPDLIAMLNTSPQDFTYIDQYDKVAYFSEGKNPVFDRTRTIIGRDVRHCHPPKAVPVVEQMLRDFKSGAKDEEVRIITPGNKVLLIRYYAVRDEANEYVGTLEVTEEISGIVDQVNQLRNRL